MSQSNGHQKSLIEKQELAKALKRLVGDVEDRFGKALGEAVLIGQEGVSTTRKELLELVDRVRKEASVPIAKNYVDTEPIAKELARQSEDRANERAVMKDLIDAALSQPAPIVQAPEHSIEVNPTPVTFDLSALASALDDLSETMNRMIEVFVAQQQDRQKLVELMAQTASINGALLAALSKPRQQEPMTVMFNEEGTGFTIQR